MTDLTNDRWNTQGKAKRERKATGRKTATEVKKEKEAKAAAEKVAAEKALPTIAKEVTVRLEKADKFQGQADDHRLAAALKLAEAKKLVAITGVAFQTWAKENITQFAFETVRKLAVIGSAENPAEALKEFRARNAEYNKKLRDKRKDLPKPERGATKKEAVVDVVLKGLDAMPDAQRKKLLESVAQNEGLAVVPAAEVSKAAPEGNPVDAAKKAFLVLTKVERKAFVDWAQEKITADAVADKAIDEGKEPEMPAFLDRRTRKTEPADVAEKPARTRRTRKTKAA